MTKKISLKFDNIDIIENGNRLKFQIDTDKLNLRKLKNSIVPNLVHGLNAKALKYVILKCKEAKVSSDVTSTASTSTSILLFAGVVSLIIIGYLISAEIGHAAHTSLSHNTQLTAALAKRMENFASQQLLDLTEKVQRIELNQISIHRDIQALANIASDFSLEKY
jgi:hypothetical protein